jgi:hypothetical protein
MKFNRLKFGYIGTSYGSYTSRDYFRFTSYKETRDEMQETILNTNPVFRMCISTCVSPTWLSIFKGKHWLIEPKFFMILDCDSELDRARIQSNLQQRRIDYARVSSGTEGHYWFFCNKVGTVAEITTLMRNIPGCDLQYAEYCMDQNSIHVRAFPKAGIFPKTDTMGTNQSDDIYVVLHDSGHKSVKSFKKLISWVREFKVYWSTFSVGENSNIVSAQLGLLDLQNAEAIFRDSIMVQEEITPIEQKVVYFDYGKGGSQFNPIGEIDLSDVSPIKAQQDEYNAISVDSL